MVMSMVARDAARCGPWVVAWPALGAWHDPAQSKSFGDQAQQEVLPERAAQLVSRAFTADVTCPMCDTEASPLLMIEHTDGLHYCVVPKYDMALGSRLSPTWQNCYERMLWLDDPGKFGGQFELSNYFWERQDRFQYQRYVLGRLRRMEFERRMRERGV